MAKAVWFISGVLAIGLVAIGLFAYVGHKDSLKRVEMAVLVGEGEYGAFLTQNQKIQLDQLLTRYNQGYFFDLYIAAPESLQSYGKPPFAVAEYLKKKGMNASQLRIDDKSQTVVQLADRVHAVMMQDKGFQTLVFAEPLMMPRVKQAFASGDRMAAGFAHTSKLHISDFPLLAGEMIKLASGYLGRGEAIAQEVPFEVAAREQEPSIVLKPLSQVMDGDDQFAWKRVVVPAQ